MTHVEDRGELEVLEARNEDTRPDRTSPRAFCDVITTQMHLELEWHGDLSDNESRDSSQRRIQLKSGQ